MFIQKTFKDQQPTLFLVGTPIGNLDDLSFRAVDTLKSVNLIFCEDTRTSSVLLKKYQIKNQVQSLHKFNEQQQVNQVVKLIGQNQNFALISDAGVPIISDPGAYLVHELRWVKELNFNVSAINVGPAYIHALICSGFLLPTNYFYGFLKNKNLPSKIKELTTIFTTYENVVVSFYESVHRIKQTMKALVEVLDPTIKMTLNRELTKINEEIIFGTVSEVNEFVQSPAFVEKGEFVIVVENQKTEKRKYNDQELLKLMTTEIDQGLKVNEASKKVSLMTNVNKNYLYELFVKQK